MKIQIIRVILIFGFSLPFSLKAQMYKCTDSKGKVSYTSSPCDINQNAKVIEEPHYNEESRLKELQILKERDSRYQESLQRSSLAEDEAALQDALAKNDLVRVSVLSKKIRSKISKQNQVDQGAEDQIETERAIMNSKIQSLKNEKILMENKMQNDMHRMESQQRLNQAFPPMWNR